LMRSVSLMRSVRLTVNGDRCVFEVSPTESLLDVLRDRLGLTGAKRGCEKGDCGACTVIVDGDAVCSCLVSAAQADGSDVLTIEGFTERPEWALYERAFLAAGAVQCGYCTPGMILSTKALLDRNPRPTRAQIEAGISGNLCRCTGYVQIVEAVDSLAGALADAKLVGERSPGAVPTGLAARPEGVQPWPS
jgi:carbon-monoxide dehydrogenase small subunit